MKKIVSFIVGVGLFSSVVSADFLGGEVGYATWGTKLSGYIKKKGDEVDFEKDLGYGKNKTNGFAWAYIDHPVPILPNIKIQKTFWEDSSRGLLDKNISFADKSFNYNTYVDSSLKLDQLDIIAYWRLLDNWVNLDLGLNTKSIDGNIQIKDVSNPTNYTDEDFKAIIPMLYMKARFDMPFTGLSVEADGSYVSYSGSSISDIKGGLVYQVNLAPMLAVGATVGYRQEEIKLDDVDDIYGDIKIKGTYFGAFLHF